MTKQFQDDLLLPDYGETTVVSPVALEGHELTLLSTDGLTAVW